MSTATDTLKAAAPKRDEVSVKVTKVQNEKIMTQGAQITPTAKETEETAKQPLILVGKTAGDQLIYTTFHQVKFGIPFEYNDWPEKTGYGPVVSQPL